MKFLQNILAYGQTYEIAMKNINKRFICNNFTGKFYESMDFSGYQIINRLLTETEKIILNYSFK